MSDKDYGCKNTEMRTLQHQFEKEHSDWVSLDLTIKRDAPHYSNLTTRIVYFDWKSKQ